MNNTNPTNSDARLEYPVTVRTCHRRGLGLYPQDASPIRKIRVVRGLDAIPHFLGDRRRAGQPLAWGLEPWGPKRKKLAEYSHWLSFATTPGEARPFTELSPAASVASDVERMAAAGEDVGLYRVAGIPV